MFQPFKQFFGDSYSAFSDYTYLPITRLLLSQPGPVANQCGWKKLYHNQHNTGTLFKILKLFSLLRYFLYNNFYRFGHIRFVEQRVRRMLELLTLQKLESWLVQQGKKYKRMWKKKETILIIISVLIVSEKKTPCQ